MGESKPASSVVAPKLTSRCMAAVHDRTKCSQPRSLDGHRVKSGCILRIADDSMARPRVPPYEVINAVEASSRINQC